MHPVLFTNSQKFWPMGNSNSQIEFQSALTLSFLLNDFLNCIIKRRMSNSPIFGNYIWKIMQKIKILLVAKRTMAKKVEKLRTPKDFKNKILHIFWMNVCQMTRNLKKWVGKSSFTSEDAMSSHISEWQFLPNFNF